jgi:hypothetical protein
MCRSCEIDFGKLSSVERWCCIWSMEVSEMVLDGGGGYRDEEIRVVQMKGWCLIICVWMMERRG